MGDQNYGLRGLTRFSDNEGDIIWPAWRAELKQLVKFEIGSIGNKIIEGEFNEEDVIQGEVDGDINLLVNALIPKARAEVQTRSDWMERVEIAVESSSSSSGSARQQSVHPELSKFSVCKFMLQQEPLSRAVRIYSPRRAVQRTSRL